MSRPTPFINNHHLKFLIKYFSNAICYRNYLTFLHYSPMIFEFHVYCSLTLVVEFTPATREEYFSIRKALFNASPDEVYFNARSIKPQLESETAR